MTLTSPQGGRVCVPGRRIAVIALLATLPVAGFAQDPDPNGLFNGAPPEGALASSRASSRAGGALYQMHCATCHLDQASANHADIQPPPFYLLKQFSPEKILEALNTGKMQPMAAALSTVERQQIAEWISGRPLGSADNGSVAHMANRCAADPPLAISGGQWANSGPSLTNDRLQPTQAAGITAAQIPRLRVKWAFAAPNAVEMYSQPVVAGGRVFFSTDNAYLYALDARTGCAYWSFHGDAASRTAPVFAPIPGKPGSYGIFFGDKAANFYALDARHGTLLWKTKIDDHPRALITGSPTVYHDKVFIGISAGETAPGADPHYACCTSRGSVVALALATGKVLWKTYTIAETPHVRGKNALGVELWGPAGASVWNAPTVDTRRNLVYVGTGNAYTLPATSTSDAMLAFDIDTGKLMWSHQEFTDDAFITGCPPSSDGSGNCPKVLGPDYDFGGASLILHKSANGRDLLVGAGKGGIAVAIDPDKRGAVVWRRQLYAGAPPPATGLVVFGAAADERNAYYPLQRSGGGLTAVRLDDGALLWTADVKADDRGQAQAASAIPGVVFTGGWDGILRAVSTDGKVIWSYNAIHDFETVNGVPGRGGSFGAPGAAIANGMVYVGSGYVGVLAGTPGNVMIAFAPD
jgi:polyvinyl alcohol dehydrogenase (cytochrome)